MPGDAPPASPKHGIGHRKAEASCPHSRWPMAWPNALERAWLATAFRGGLSLLDGAGRTEGRGTFAFKKNARKHGDAFSHLPKHGFGHRKAEASCPHSKKANRLDELMERAWLAKLAARSPITPRCECLTLRHSD